MSQLIKQAFTLIELLVVIAIIGILSGLIVVAMGGVTQKATIAKAQVFSNSLRNSLMLNLVAEYKLDGNANDTWGSHSGTLHGTTSSSDCIYGSCLSFNGSSSDYINISDDDAAFNFGTKITVMAWIKGNAQSEKAIVSQFTSAGNQRSWLLASQWYSGNPVKNFEIYLSDDGTNVSAHYKSLSSNGQAFDGNWHLIGFTFSSGAVNMYLDGAIDGHSTAIGITSLYNSNANLYINGFDGGNYFNGQMDEIRLYKEAISGFQIKEQYYAGLNKLLNSGQITKKDYLSRINNIANK